MNVRVFPDEFLLDERISKIISTGSHVRLVGYSAISRTKSAA
jgi:hypothetical protein